MQKEINELRDTDWVHIHISERALSFGGVTYNFNSKTHSAISVPDTYFGESFLSTKRYLAGEDSQNDDDGDSEDE